MLKIRTIPLVRFSSESNFRKKETKQFGDPFELKKASFPIELINLIQFGRCLMMPYWNSKTGCCCFIVRRCGDWLAWSTYWNRHHSIGKHSDTLLSAWAFVYLVLFTEQFVFLHFNSFALTFGLTFLLSSLNPLICLKQNKTKKLAPIQPIARWYPVQDW